jgi:hypothetical protein
VTGRYNDAVPLLLRMYIILYFTVQYFTVQNISRVEYCLVFHVVLTGQFCLFKTSGFASILAFVLCLILFKYLIISTEEFVTTKKDNFRFVNPHFSCKPYLLSHLSICIAVFPNASFLITCFVLSPKPFMVDKLKMKWTLTDTKIFRLLTKQRLSTEG